MACPSSCTTPHRGVLWRIAGWRRSWHAPRPGPIRRRTARASSPRTKKESRDRRGGRMRKALGKGLEALFPEQRTPEAAAAEYSVPVGEIVPNPEQPRRQFDTEALAALAGSIARHGLLQPLLVRRVAGHYELIAGERRLRAAQQAG